TEPNRTEIIQESEYNLNENRILQLKALFPEAFCEEQIDWEKLKLILGADNLAHQGERYQLNWAGKTDAYRTLQAPTFNTLSPCREESVDFDNTRNLFIEAENLEALKILQKAYAGSVKMIYIDPPYNTGNDSFIYPDKFSESREEYARRVGDKDADGYLKRDGVFQGAWRKNSKDSGHYHSNWLSMMLPRLHLARTLLRDDGVIFISIDDNEQAQLKLLCDEVFGAENFVEQLTREAIKGGSLSLHIRSTHDYVLCFAKNIDLVSFTGFEKDALELNLSDEKGAYAKGRELNKWGAGSRKEDSPGMWFPIKGPNGEDVYPIRNDGSEGRWRMGKQKMAELVENNDVIFEQRLDGTYIVYEKLRGNKSKYTQMISILKDKYINANASENLKNLFQAERAIFDFSKPPALIADLIKISESEVERKTKDSIIIDFFSGSGTTAHAVMQLNAEDGGNRRYLCVQLPEETEEKSEARKASFDTIAEIAKERIRRAGKQISDSLKEGQSVDTGFKVFKLAESNFKTWKPQPRGETENWIDKMEKYIDNIADGATPENMVYELMLRLGCKLTSTVQHKNSVYWVTDEDTGKRIALLLEQINQTLIEEVIAAAPAKVVALDKLFDDNDALKSNTVLQMKDTGIVFECV
ncbi:MAG: site-specific DNA-methyltransferase, partial [Cardiobacterium sp.]